jgi:hypothetical protein
VSADTLNQRLIIYLRNIANGNWNVGREPDKVVSVNDYAREALQETGLDRGAGEPHP